MPHLTRNQHLQNVGLWIGTPSPISKEVRYVWRPTDGCKCDPHVLQILFNLVQLLRSRDLFYYKPFQLSSWNIYLGIKFLKQSFVFQVFDYPKTIKSGIMTVKYK